MSSRTAAGRKRMQNPSAPKPSKNGFKLSALKSIGSGRGRTANKNANEEYPSPPLSDAPLPGIPENEQDRLGYHDHGDAGYEYEQFSYSLSPQRRQFDDRQDEFSPPVAPFLRSRSNSHSSPTRPPNSPESVAPLSPQFRYVRNPVYQDIPTATSSATTLSPLAQSRRRHPDFDDVPTASSSSSTLPTHLNVLGLKENLDRRMYPSPPSSDASSSFSQFSSTMLGPSVPYHGSRRDGALSPTYSTTSDVYSESSSSDSGSTFSRIHSLQQFPEPPPTPFSASAFHRDRDGGLIRSPQSGSFNISPTPMSPVTISETSLPTTPSSSSKMQLKPVILASSRSFDEGQPQPSQSHSPNTSRTPPASPTPAFVFPTSRSRAHPKSEGPKIKFGRKKRDKDKGKGVEASSNLSRTSSNTSTPTTSTFDFNRPKGPRTSPKPPSSDNSSDSSSLRARSHRSSVGSDVTTKGAIDGFVFPSSRSRGRPNAPPIKFGARKKAAKEGVSPTSPLSPGGSALKKSPTSSDERSQSFMGIPLRGRRDNNGNASSWRDTPLLESEIDPFTLPGGYFIHRKGQAVHDAPGPSSTRPTPLKARDVYPSIGHSQPEPGRSLPLPPSSSSSTTVNTLRAPSPVTYGSDQEVSHQEDAVPEVEPQVTFNYPFNSYDPALLESDKHTHALLQQLIGLASPEGPGFNSDSKESSNLPRLESTNPSFYNYGYHPPSKVLDLGCGAQALWVREAAMKWGGYGTSVVGMDLVEVLAEVADDAGMGGNGVTFVKGNFITQPLPFPNNSFDFVRIANLTFAIPYEKWEFVLQEVSRVLMVGGRLEVIDDHVFWPYGKTPTIEGREDAGDSDLGDEDWDEHITTSKSLELLFERLMNDGYGIHLTPSSFLLDMIQDVMGHGREVKTMHLTLALPGSESGEENGEGSQFGSSSDVLQDSPGLVLWPSTLMPMSPHELQAQALKHLRMLLTCKDALVEEYLNQLGFFDEDHWREAGEYEEYAQEARDALQDYEEFLHRRFSPPFPQPDVGESSTATFVDAYTDSYAPTPTNRSRSPSPAGTVQRKRRSVSGYSISSVATDQYSAMLDYASEMKGQFSWNRNQGSTEIPSSDGQQLAGPSVDGDGSSSGNRPRPSSVYTTRTNRTASTSYSTSPPSFLSALRGFRVPSVRYSESVREISPGRGPLPEYSIMEPTLVRTFHVYEGFKMDGNMLAVMRGRAGEGKSGF